MTETEVDEDQQTVTYSLPYTTTEEKMRAQLKGLLKVCELEKVNTMLSKEERKIACDLENLLDELPDIVQEPVNKKRKY